MGNLVKDVKSFKRNILKISGPLGKLMPFNNSNSTGGVKAGEILSYNTTTGKMELFIEGSEGEMFTIALGDSDGNFVLVALPGTIINERELKVFDIDFFRSTKGFKGIKELWSNGIILFDGGVEWR
ncbi:MAG: hypothetical protein ACRC6K_00120 [Fusobacteriaceae bacterium]